MVVDKSAVSVSAMSAELRSRLTIGPILAAIALGLLFWDINACLHGSPQHWGALILALIAAFTATPEFIRLMRPRTPGMQGKSVFVGTVALVACAWPQIQEWLTPLNDRMPVSGAAVVFGLSLAWMSLIQMRRFGTEHFIHNIGSSMLALCYLGVGLNLLLGIGVSENDDNEAFGAQVLMMTLTVVKLGDVSAFFGGKTFGKHKMSPRVSPGKTWEGFIASFIGAIGGSYLFNYIASLPWSDVSQTPFAAWWSPLIFGMVIGPVGVLGDLVESCMKRDAAVKDSAAVLPGFGGFLDVFDAVLIAAPIACVLAAVLI